ncbi:MAG: hypothetical protein ABI947_04565 [Chloroflexota bacterium]
MKRFLPFLLALLLLGIVLLGILFFLLRNRATSIVALPTLAVLPSATATHTATPTIIPTNTLLPTTTSTSTPTHTPSPTSTLATLVLKIIAVNADVTLQPVVLDDKWIATPTALPTLHIPTPPVKLAAVPAGDAPLIGWYEYAVQDPQIKYEGQWALFAESWHSINRRYYYSGDPKARLTFRFLGAAVRLRYVKYFNYGVFQVRIDDKVVTTIDSYYPKTGQGADGDFTTTDTFALSNGWHTLEIVSLAQKNPASGGLFIAVDGIEVYLNGPAPTNAPPVFLTPTLTPSPAAAQKIELVAAPPALLPTPTDLPPAITAVSLTIAYDKNNNKAADTNEGVQGIAVRLITVDTNQVVTTSYTNQEGYVHLEATGNSPLRLVVPYLNKFWEVPARSNSLRITLLLPPANQPGLIP